MPPLPPRAEHPNKLKKQNREQVKAFEAQHNAKVVENEDGLFAFDVMDTNGKKARIANLEETTVSGFPVIAFAFLDEDEILEVEKAKKEKPAATSPFGGPGIAGAHFSSSGHYHNYLNCSWVYTYPDSWDILIYVCPADTGQWGWVPGAVAGALGIALGHPWLAWFLGIGVNYGFSSIKEPDGSIWVYFEGSAVRERFGWGFWWGQVQDWFYGWSDRVADAFGWATKWSDNSWWRIYH